MGKERFLGSMCEGYSRYTVLIIDDDDEVRETYGMILNLMGIRFIFQAKNGEEGVRLYVEHIDEVDLIILDMNMPLMDGPAFFREFKRLNCGRTRMAKVILATGNYSSPVVAQLLEEGIDKALQKPIDLDDIEKNVQQLLNTR